MQGKISKIKFYNSVKASSKGGAATQLDYVDTTTGAYAIYDISIKDSFISIRNKDTNEMTYSTISNVVYFSLKD